jgi:putative endonuclease
MNHPNLRQTFFYVYILQSVSEPFHTYTGFTEDLRERPRAHNHGQDPHTAKYRPWYFKTCVAFTDREQALAFERYLKTQFGRAFSKKRL